MPPKHVERRAFLKGCAAGAAGLAVESAGIAAMLGVTQPSAAALGTVAQQAVTSICGLHNPGTVEQITESGAQAVRMIISPIVFNSSGIPADKLAILQNFPANVKLILSLYWIDQPNSCSEDQDPVYLPDESTQETWAQWAIDMIQAMNSALPDNGSTVNVVALENEPFVQYLSSDIVQTNGTSKMGQWFQLLTRTIGAWAATNAPSLHISAPAWTNTSNQNYLSAYSNWLHYQVNQVRPQYLSYFDFHAHVSNLTNLNTVITNAMATLGSLDLTVMCTEWSQAKYFTNWLAANISECFSSQYPLPPGVITNMDYICSFMGYKNSSCVEGTQDPTSLDEWNDWIASSGITGDFVPQAYSALVNTGVTIPCYGGAQQYGNASFDVDQLYASMTVGPSYANYGFLAWYQQLTNTPVTQPEPTGLSCQS